MLEQRVIRDRNGFHVLREAGQTRELFYGLFDLQMNPDDEIKMKNIPYWSGGAAFSVNLGGNDTCVRVVEKEGDRIAETYEFYYTPNGRAGDLRLSMERARNIYGKNAYLITVEWIGCRAEPINSRYIYLENKDGECFYFLRDTIEAMNPDGKRLMDQYVTRLSLEDNIKNYKLKASPLVHQKYTILE